MFACIPAAILDTGRRFILMGDWNAKIKNRFEILKSNNRFSYTPDGEPGNWSGAVLQSLCCDLVVLNNLIYKGKLFSDSLTFRKKDIWLSQLDMCICSRDLIDNILIKIQYCHPITR